MGSSSILASLLLPSNTQEASPLFMVGSASASLVVLASERQDSPRQEAPSRRRDMDAQAGMLARLFERSMGLGDEWEVSDVWFEEREGAQDELHARMAHRKGRTAGCLACSWAVQDASRSVCPWKGDCAQAQGRALRLRNKRGNPRQVLVRSRSISSTRLSRTWSPVPLELRRYWLRPILAD